MSNQFKVLVVLALVSGFLGGFALGQTSYVNNVDSVIKKVAENSTDYSTALATNQDGSDDEKAENTDTGELKESSDVADNNDTKESSSVSSDLQARYEGVTLTSGSLVVTPSMGDPKAKVLMVEYSDYQCPFCASYYSQTLPTIIEEYVKTGKVKIEFKDFPLSFHKNAIPAANAAYCAGEQDAFWYMHDVIFEGQQEWGTATEPKVIFAGYAEELGLDKSKFTSCYDENKYLKKIQAGMKEGSDIGVDGTPGFSIAGQTVVGAHPFSTFKQAIDAALKK